MRFVPAAAATLAILVSATSPAAATEALVFDDGRELAVEAWEVRGEFLHVTLVGGGRMALPREGIEAVRTLPAPSAPEPSASEESPEDTWRDWAGEFAELVDGAASRHRVDPVLLVAMMRIESNFDPFAVSPKGACGLMQLIPATAERFGVADVFDPAQNIDGGARYLRWLLERFEGDTNLALAAYNAGENAVDRYGGVPPYRETRNYVRKVLGKFELFQSARPVGDRLASAR
jgi:soluble lytic murein transglycosylase-like protein